MRIQPSAQIEIASPGGASEPFSALKTGDTVSVRLAALEGATALLKAQDVSVRASLPPGTLLLEGDVLALVLTDRQNGRLSFKLLSVNGRYVLPEADRLEQSLLQLGISPTARNIRLAQYFRQNGYTPGPEVIAAFEAIAAKAPGLPAAVATFMAARGMMPDETEAMAFSRPGGMPDRLPGELSCHNFYYAQIPVWLENRGSKAELFVFRDVKRADDESGPAVVFISLQTRNTGRVEAKLHYVSGELTVHLFLESQSLQSYYRLHLDALKEALDSGGLRLLGIFAADADAARPQDEGFIGGIDIKV